MIWRIKRCVENLCFVTLVPPLFTHIFTLLLKVQPWVDVFFPAFPTVGFFGSTVEDFHPPNLTSQTLGSDPQDWLSRLDLSIMWGDPFCRFFLLIYFKIPLVACFTVNCECINIYIQNMFICDMYSYIYIFHAYGIAHLVGYDSASQIVLNPHEHETSRHGCLESRRGSSMSSGFSFPNTALVVWSPKPTPEPRSNHVEGFG